MSYCSDNQIPITASLKNIKEVIELLGYKKCKDALSIPGQVGSYYWSGNDDNISFVGVELYIYKEDEYYSVQTRSRIGRSYWDLEQQNKTILLLKNIFGGSFETDEGKNKRMLFDEKEPDKLACALFISRWVFNNQLMKAKMYLNNRELNGDFSKDESSGLLWIDEMNPRVLSNNMLLPYLIGCWESYFRQSYIAILKYANEINDNALKNSRITNSELLNVIRNGYKAEWYLADSLSFQRPSIIDENFRRLNSNIQIQSWLKKPYHRRKVSLFDSLTDVINVRDTLVHNGQMDISLFDKEAKKIIDDITAAVDRVYEGFGRAFNFNPSYDF